MVVNIRLADRFDMDSTDTMGRTWAGWDPNATEKKLWENNRGRHGFGVRVLEEQFASLSYQGTIRLVARIAGREETPKPESTQRKWALIGEVLPQGDPVRDALVGQPVAPGRNSFIYIDDPFGFSGASSAVASAEAGDSAGQGWMQDPEKRELVEDAAQDKLTRNYEAQGWTVDDTRFGNPFDACASREDEILYLEAKGTVSAGSTVIVSRNEVAWARSHPGDCVLGILSDVSFSPDGELDTSDATFRVFRWEPDDHELDARSYDWQPSERKQIFQAPRAADR